MATRGYKKATGKAVLHRKARPYPMEHRCHECGGRGQVEDGFGNLVRCPKCYRGRRL